MSAGTVENFCLDGRNTIQMVLQALKSVSCPNVECEGMAFGGRPKGGRTSNKAVCKVTDKPVIEKLSPNVTDIVEIAKAVKSRWW